LDNRRNIASLRIFGPIIDAIVVGLTFLSAIKGREAFRRLWPYDLIPSVGETLQPLSEQTHIELLVIIIPVWCFFLWNQNTYELPRANRTDLLFIRIVRSSAISTVALLALLFALGLTVGVSRSLIVFFAALSILTVFLARRAMIAVIRHLRKRGLDPHNIVVIGTLAEAAPFIRSIQAHADWGIRVIGVVLPDDTEHENTADKELKVPMLGQISGLSKILERHPIHQVFVTGRAWEKDELYKIADSCEELGVQFSMDANFLGLRVAKADLQDIEGWSVLSFTSTPSSAEAMAVKRILDIFASIAALIILSPIILFTAIAIKLSDRGPIFFGQERSGLFGKTFKMWKFRSMVINAEALKKDLESQNEMGGPVFKIKKDPRITRFGSFIRKSSIDELPQIWNVLMGDMSLVGPRPPIPAEVEKYERWQMRRLSMRPGITCIWQVSGRNNIDFDSWMKLDLQYIDNWTLFLDIKLLLKTVPVVLLRKGAS
jgi:exopolysaccharide biosynthesis polyprenyl glycosylphosphotransferase